MNVVKNRQEEAVIELELSTFAEIAQSHSWGHNNPYINIQKSLITADDVVEPSQYLKYS